MDFGLLYLTSGALLFGIAAGIFLGGHIIGRNVLDEVARVGFFNLNGVRYRVDRIGRKPRDESK